MLSSFEVKLIVFDTGGFAKGDGVSYCLFVITVVAGLQSTGSRKKGSHCGIDPYFGYMRKSAGDHQEGICGHTPPCT